MVERPDPSAAQKAQSPPVRVDIASTNVDPSVAERVEPKIPPAAEAFPTRAGAAPLRVALAHDWLCGYRGGEGVLERLSRLVTSEHQAAGLYVMFDDRRDLAPSVDTLTRTVSPLSRVPLGPTKLRRWLLPLYPRAVETLSVALARAHRAEPVDLVLSTSSAAIKGLRPPPGVPHLCYCHAPARYLWSQTEEYAKGGRLTAAGLKLFGNFLRSWDLATSANVTHFVANSSHIAAEIQRCYGRAARVIHPPVRTEYFTPPQPGTERMNFWLVVAAMEPYKRIELAIQAANKSQHPLWIIGDGSQRARLEAMAGETVHFLGRVSDAELRGYYRRARVLLFPQVEDFGIVAAEALACGLPVVARRAGGALDIVTDGVTGSFFDQPTPEALLEAIRRAPDSVEAGAACRQSALRFSEDRFDAQMRDEIAAVAASRTTGANSAQRSG